MEITIYVPNTTLELSGENRWRKLVLAHCVLWVLSWSLFYLLYAAIGYHWMLLLFGILVAYSLIVFTNLMIARGRHREYGQEEINFAPSGIYLSANKNSSDYKKIKTSSLADAKIILHRDTLKFMVYGFDKPYFEFTPSSFNSDLISSRNIVHAIVAILGLEVHREVRLGTGLVFDFEAIDFQHYQPRYYCIQALTDKSIIRAKQDEQNPQLIRSTIEFFQQKRAFKYRFQTPFFRELSTDQVLKFEIDVVDKPMVNSHNDYLEGQLYALTKEGKKQKVFVLNRFVDKQLELMKLELLRDFEYLKDYLLRKIN